MRKVILAGLSSGTCVYINGRWDVLCKKHNQSKDWCVVDFWDGGREQVHASQVVSVA